MDGPEGDSSFHGFCLTEEDIEESGVPKLSESDVVKLELLGVSGTGFHLDASSDPSMVLDLLADFEEDCVDVIDDDEQDSACIERDVFDLLVDNDGEVYRDEDEFLEGDVEELGGRAFGFHLDGDERVHENDVAAKWLKALLVNDRLFKEKGLCDEAVHLKKEGCSVGSLGRGFNRRFNGMGDVRSARLLRRQKIWDVLSS